MSPKKLLICFAIAFNIISFYSTNAQLVEKWRVDIPALPDYYYPTYHFDSIGNVYGIRSKYLNGNYTFNIYKVSVEGVLEWSIEDTPILEGGDFRFGRSGVDKYGNIYLLGCSSIYDIIAQIPGVVKYSSNGTKLFEKVISPSEYQAGSVDVRAWGVDNDGNIFAVGVKGILEGNTIPTYGYAMGISPEGVRISESILEGIDICNQSNGPKGPDMFGNYIVEFSSYTSGDEIIDHFVGFNSFGGIRWTASSLPLINPGPKFDLTNYHLFQFGNMYYLSWTYNLIEKYSLSFQHQWTKNYTNNYSAYLRSESPYDESVLIYESEENPPLACYNADGLLRWRKNYPAPAYWNTTYGPEHDIYTIVGTTVPSTLMRINYLTGETVWIDTVNLGTNATISFARIRVNSEGIITYAGVDRVVQFLQGIEITHPKKDTLMIAGEVDTIRWKGGKEDQFLSLEYSIDGGSTYNWINLEQVEASEEKYAWDIPNDLIGRKAIIKILDASNGDSLGASDTFKIKPYIITRVDENGEYVAYDKNTDRWGFWNDDPDIWPSSWYQNFDYWGQDPFTSKNYSVWQGDSVFYKAKDSDHPDWVSFVNTFGVNACYADTYIGSYYPKALQLWKSKKGSWGGSCFGIAISNALAFEKRDQFQTVYPDFPDIISPYLVTSDTNTIKVVNELFTYQYGNPHFSIRNNSYNNKTPTETINDLKKMLKEDDVKIRTLAFYSNSTDPQNQGGHSIVAYKLTRNENSPEVYYVSVYDNSYPLELNAEIRVDTSDNDGKGSWLPYYGWNDWGGDKWFFLEDSADSYFSNPVMPKLRVKRSAFIFEEDKLNIYNSSDAYIVIEDNSGNQTGLTSIGLITDIPNSVPLIKLDGGIGPPYGYYLPKDNYSVVMSNFLADTINTFFFTGNKSFEYERYGATNSQTDRLFFDGGVSVVNPDAEEKSIKLVNITTTTDDEKVFVLRSLELVQNDSVKIENPDDNRLNLISFGSAKNYQIELNQASQIELGRFLKSNVPLPQNTTHKVLPDWTDITNTSLMILVDIGNDGTIDDTLNLENEVTGIGNDHGSLIPSEYRLEQNYPNPFNPSTVIGYQLPVGGNAILKVFDILGNEVATLIDEYKPAGMYEVEFNVAHESLRAIASGVYFYQLKASNYLETKKMILLR